LNFDVLKEIVEYAKARAKDKILDFPVMSNLYKLDHNKIDWMIKNGVDIGSSLDGPPYVHNKNRFLEEGKPTYDEVVKTAQYMLEKYNKTTGFLNVITRYSLPYHKEIIDEYVKWKQSEIMIKPLNKLGFARRTWNEIGYSQEEYLDFFKKSLDYLLN
jgi:uncharacterized protein